MYYFEIETIYQTLSLKIRPYVCNLLKPCFIQTGQDYQLKVRNFKTTELFIMKIIVTICSGNLFKYLFNLFSKKIILF